jgi:hypothetical protein
MVQVSWTVAGNPLAIGPLEIMFRWLSLTDGIHDYHNMPPYFTTLIAPHDLATLVLVAWHGPVFYQYKADAELYIHVNQPSPTPPPPPPPPQPCTYYYFVLRTDDPDALTPCIPLAVCADDEATAQSQADQYADQYGPGYTAGPPVDYDTYLTGCDS